MTLSEIAPWLSESTANIRDSRIRFHNEIIEFYDYLSPKKSAHKIRTTIFRCIKKIIESGIVGSTVYLFGSTSTQMYLNNSDIDILIMKEDLSVPQLLRKTRKVLKGCLNIFSDINCVETAKVPIIKCTYTESDIDIDIAFNCIECLSTTEEMNNALLVHYEIKYIYLIFKLFLRQRRLNNTFTGGLGSFLLFCMILAFLRQFKKNLYYKKRNMDHVDNATLSDYVLGFLNFYANFDVVKKEIHISDGGMVKQKSESSLYFKLISPVDQTVNIAGQSYRMREIFGVFRNRFKVMTNKAYREGNSILADLINPASKDFDKLYL